MTRRRNSIRGRQSCRPTPYNAHAWFVATPTVGEGTWIGAFTVIDGSGGLTIGKGCDISSGVHIYTHSSARRCVSARAHPWWTGSRS